MPADELLERAFVAVAGSFDQDGISLLHSPLDDALPYENVGAARWPGRIRSSSTPNGRE
jgi:hypothetical protein